LILVRVSFSRRSLLDLDQIRRFIDKESGNPEIADQVLRKIAARIDILKRFPEAGCRRSDLKPDVRSLVAGTHIVLYRVEESRIRILRVIRGSREIPKLDI
jgi:toxin ParE1/3/4